MGNKQSTRTASPLSEDPVIVSKPTNDEDNEARAIISGLEGEDEWYLAGGSGDSEVGSDIRRRDEEDVEEDFEYEGQFACDNSN